MNSFFPYWLQDINTALGLIGFVITVWVMIQLGSIKRSFRSRARLPEIILELEQSGSALNKALAGWPTQRNDAHSQIKVASSLIQSALQFVPNPTKRRAKFTQKKLETAARKFTEREYNNAGAVWDLYSDIQSTIVSLNQVNRNLNWE